MAAITGSASLVSGPGSLGAHNLTGIYGPAVLVCGPATIAAVVVRGHSGTGALTAANASLTATGGVGRTNNGYLIAADAGLFATGQVGRTGTAALASGAATLSARAAIGPFALGTLFSAAATFAASGTRQTNAPNAALASGAAAISALGTVAHSSQANLAAGAATLAAIGQRGAKGTAALVAGEATLAVVTGQDYVIRGEVFSDFILAGTVAIDLSGFDTVESDYERTGYRPSFGPILHAINARGALDVNTLAVGQRFLVTAVGANILSEFKDAGANPDDIGQVVALPGGTRGYVFRAPAVNEVGWSVLDNKLVRYEEDTDTGAIGWAWYSSVTERFLDGMYAFNVLDPDGIYPYYGRVVGLTYSAWAADAMWLARQFDPDETSRWYLTALLNTLGDQTDALDSENVKRTKAKTTIKVSKLSGTEKASTLRARALGYDMELREVWVNPGGYSLRLSGNIANLPIASESPAILFQGFAGRGDNRDAVAHIVWRAVPNDGDTITIPLPSGASVVFEFNDATVNPATTPGRVAVAIVGTDPSTSWTNFKAALAANLTGVTLVDVTASNFAGPPIGTLPASSSPTGAGSDFITVPHGMLREYRLPYFPSSGVAVFLARQDGTFVLPTSTIKERFNAELSKSALPVWSSIRYFGGIETVAEEAVGVSESFTIVQTP